ncbi:ORF140 peptide [Hyphantria cunea nucleopolyhedrovirus]|uniref:ORF140 peptide n=1 Tax=Hyphantria cunea nuclear polyhedrosis virus TaxID=28288 RepID=Q2NP58_NPVHC|nr:ORF140 peptide [Hyphantria cunea nucleopolyhedrovirus]BAE72429.1 ORF140 peptide [Hyphantria cunea nucleopolyhedrovirus]
MFNWILSWWDNVSGEQQQQQQQHPPAKFDDQAYKQYAVNKRAHSDLVRWDVFRCYPFAFKFRYVTDNSSNDRCCSVVDFCKGLEINHDLLLKCNFDHQHVLHLDELMFNAPRVKAVAADIVGSLFATKQGLLQLLQQLPFVNKDDVLLAIRTDKGYDRDDVRDKIEAVLKHIKTLTANSDKFISAHKSFKLEVGARFEQFEQRLESINTKVNALQAPTQTTEAPVSVVFPRDVTKHPHLAVFMGRAEETGNTQIAFARGQENHFRRRKLEFEDNMDVMFEGVHPNPLLAMQCIKEEFYNSGHKIRRLSKKVIEVKCAVNVAKDIVKKAIINKDK